MLRVHSDARLPIRRAARRRDAGDHGKRLEAVVDGGRRELLAVERDLDRSKAVGHRWRQAEDGLVAARVVVRGGHARAAEVAHVVRAVGEVEAGDHSHRAAGIGPVRRDDRRDEWLGIVDKPHVVAGELLRVDCHLHRGGAGDDVRAEGDVEPSREAVAVAAVPLVGRPQRDDPVRRRRPALELQVAEHEALAAVPDAQAHLVVRDLDARVAAVRKPAGRLEPQQLGAAEEDEQLRRLLRRADRAAVDEEHREAAGATLRAEREHVGRPEAKGEDLAAGARLTHLEAEGCAEEVERDVRLADERHHERAARLRLRPREHRLDAVRAPRGRAPLVRAPRGVAAQLRVRRALRVHDEPAGELRVDRGGRHAAHAARVEQRRRHGGRALRRARQVAVAGPPLADLPRKVDEVGARERHVRPAEDGARAGAERGDGRLHVVQVRGGVGVLLPVERDGEVERRGGQRRRDARHVRRVEEVGLLRRVRHGEAHLGRPRRPAGGRPEDTARVEVAAVRLALARTPRRRVLGGRDDPGAAVAAPVVRAQLKVDAAHQQRRAAAGGAAGREDGRDRAVVDLVAREESVRRVGRVLAVQRDAQRHLGRRQRRRERAGDVARRHVVLGRHVRRAEAARVPQAVVEHRTGQHDARVARRGAAGGREARDAHWRVVRERDRVGRVLLAVEAHLDGDVGRLDERLARHAHVVEVVGVGGEAVARREREAPRGLRRQRAHLEVAAVDGGVALDDEAERRVGRLEADAQRHPAALAPARLQPQLLEQHVVVRDREEGLRRRLLRRVELEAQPGGGAHLAEAVRRDLAVHDAEAVATAHAAALGVVVRAEELAAADVHARAQIEGAPRPQPGARQQECAVVKVHRARQLEHALLDARVAEQLRLERRRRGGRRRGRPRRAGLGGGGQLGRGEPRALLEVVVEAARDAGGPRRGGDARDDLRRDGARLDDRAAVPSVDTERRVEVRGGGEPRVLELARLVARRLQAAHADVERLVAVEDRVRRLAPVVPIDAHDGGHVDLVQVDRGRIARELLAVERDREQRRARGVVARRRAQQRAARVVVRRGHVPVEQRARAERRRVPAVQPPPVAVLPDDDVAGELGLSSDGAVVGRGGLLAEAADVPAVAGARGEARAVDGGEGADGAWRVVGARRRDGHRVEVEGDAAARVVLAVERHLQRDGRRGDGRRVALHRGARRVVDGARRHQRVVEQVVLHRVSALREAAPRVRAAAEVGAVDGHQRVAEHRAAVDVEVGDGGRRQVGELHLVRRVRVVVHRHLDRHARREEVGAGAHGDVVDEVRVEGEAGARAEAKLPAGV